MISDGTVKIEAINYVWLRPVRTYIGTTTLETNGPRTVKSAGLENNVFVVAISPICALEEAKGLSHI